MSKINLEQELNHIRNAQDKTDAAKALLRTLEPNNPPDYNWLMTGDKTTTQCVRIALDELEKEQFGFTWIISAKCNEWGEPYKPGDIVRRVIPRDMKDRYHHPVSGETLSMAMTDGSFSEKYERHEEHRLDSNLCFKCGFSTAGYFMEQWGFHWKTKRGLTGKFEKSKDPVMRKPDGDMKHVHYWRFCALPVEQYEKINQKSQDRK